MTRWTLLANGLLASFLASASRAAAGPITANTALPVHDGEFIFRGQTQFTRSTNDPSPANRELTVWAFPTVLVYGATEKLALFGVFPYLDKKLEAGAAGSRSRRGDAGLGDTRFLARYTLHQWDKPQETLRIAPLVGFKAPTGKDDKEDERGKLPPRLQLGSGSWDAIFGTVFTWQTLAWEIDTSASYTLNTEANDFDFGDVARLDFSFQYRLSPLELSQGAPSFLYAVAESTIIWQEKDTASESSDSNSGGLTWFLAPGVQYITERFVVETAVQIPVAQELNGQALENDFVLTAGFRVNF